MRTKQLKLDGKLIQAVLIAGGPGFKLYHTDDFSGWLLVLKSLKVKILKGSQAFKTVTDYINLKYQPVTLQESIKQNFDLFIEQTRNSK